MTAMVKTWADSWFSEEGTRIFYMVPRETTDKVQPLTISPTPDETIRGLVGRIEVIPLSSWKKFDGSLFRARGGRKSARDCEKNQSEKE